MTGAVTPRLRMVLELPGVFYAADVKGGMPRRDLAPAYALVRAFEGLGDGDPSTVNLDPYLCQAGVWTIGWGHVVRDARGRALKGQALRAAARAIYPNGITRDEAATLLVDDVRPVASALEGLVPVILGTAAEGLLPRTEWFDAVRFGVLVSFTYNHGLEAFRTSTLRKRLDAGRFDLVPAELVKWNKVRDPKTGALKVSRGQVRRRRLEIEAWTTGQLPA